MKRRIDGKTVRHLDREADSQADIKPDRRTSCQLDRNTDVQTNRQRREILMKIDLEMHRNNNSYTFFSYKNHVYKNVEAQITLKFTNVVVI